MRKGPFQWKATKRFVIACYSINMANLFVAEHGKRPLEASIRRAAQLTFPVEGHEEVRKRMLLTWRTFSWPNMGSVHCIWRFWTLWWINRRHRRSPSHRIDLHRMAWHWSPSHGMALISIAWHGIDLYRIAWHWSHFFWFRTSSKEQDKIEHQVNHRDQSSW